MGSMAGSGPRNAEPASGDLGAVISRINWRLMPILLLMYVMAFLDRTNVGFAEQALQQSLGLDHAAYALGASLFFVGYAFLEVPSNLMLKRLGARNWLSRIMVSWGLVSAAMATISGEKSFYAMRLLLGIAEAGFFPGVIFLLTKFYPAQVRAQAIGFFYVGAPLSFIVGSPVSGALLELDGTAGLAGWQWLFLVEGLLATAVGILAWVLLPDGPQTARWLTDDQRAILARACSPSPARAGSAKASLPAVLRSMTVVGFGTVYMLIQMGVYGLVFFMPAQIALLFGQSVGVESGLLTAIPWFFALAGTMLLPRIADRRGNHQAIAIALLALAGLGLALTPLAPVPLAALTALCVSAAGFMAVQPVFWALCTPRLPDTHAAASIAFINTLGAVGAFLAPNLRVLLEIRFELAEAGQLGLAGLSGIGCIALILTKPRRSV